MVEARKRNPDILLGALAWAWPGYIGAGTASPWTNVTLSAGYVVDFLRGARDVYNTTIDYVDADWNERGCEGHAKAAVEECPLGDCGSEPHPPPPTAGWPTYCTLQVLLRLRQGAAAPA